jgi:hypothetical protein
VALDKRPLELNPEIASAPSRGIAFLAPESLSFPSHATIIRRGREHFAVAIHQPVKAMTGLYSEGELLTPPPPRTLPQPVAAPARAHTRARALAPALAREIE